MIIEKAVDKAKKLEKNIDYFFKEDIPESFSSSQHSPHTKINRTSRLVNLNHEFTCSRGCLGEYSETREIESYKILRTRLHQCMLKNNWNSLMVTSAYDKEGKTLTAINLALSFAKHYQQTVLLVDCDLRKQNIYKYFGYSSRLNLVDHLIDDVPLSDVMVRLNNEKIVVISGERTLDSGAELLSSSQMINLFNQLKNRYNDRIIIFDLPPVLLVADAIASSSWIESILFVVRFGKTSFKAVQNSLNRLPKEKLLGFVVNRSKALIDEYDKYLSRGET